jgi:hypothetical protein
MVIQGRTEKEANVGMVHQDGVLNVAVVEASLICVTAFQPSVPDTHVYDY